MKYLLDTHVFLWWITDNPKLSENARSLIGNINNDLFLSVASIWEMVIKSRTGKMTLPENLEHFIRDELKTNDIIILDISVDHSFEIYYLPELHKDPFDRMLIAQARKENLTILTSDFTVKQYDVKTIW